MKGIQIILGTANGQDAAALIEDGILQDLLVDADAPLPGTIYRAKAVRPVKGQGGMFLDTPDGSAFWRGAKGAAPGDLCLVQVTGYAEAGKAIPVTGKVLLKGRFVIATPGAPGINISRSIRDDEARVAARDAVEHLAAELGDIGLILRSSCADAPPEDIASEAGSLVATTQALLADKSNAVETLLDGPDIEEQIWRDWPIATFERGDVTEFVEVAASDVCTLAGSASMSVEPTRAFVAVDVNTGNDTSPAAGLKANIAAARNLPRILRLKGLGGQVVVDFAPMPKKDRRGLEAALRAAFRADDIETALVGWTPMGHYELNRKRARAPLHEILS